MLGFLKYKIPLSSVCNEYISQLERLMLNIDDLIKKANHPIAEQYENELAAFIFVLGHSVIQSSKLNEAEKKQFVVCLVDKLSTHVNHSNIISNISLHRKDLIVAEFLNHRISLYRDVVQDDDLDTQMFNLIQCFFRLSGLLSHGQLIDTYCSSFIMKNVANLRNFINTLKCEYRLTPAVVSA